MRALGLDQSSDEIDQRSSCCSHSESDCRGLLPARSRALGCIDEVHVA
jgi:hypothetical protein